MFPFKQIYVRVFLINFNFRAFNFIVMAFCDEIRPLKLRSKLKISQIVVPRKKAMSEPRLESNLSSFIVRQQTRQRTLWPEISALRLIRFQNGQCRQLEHPNNTNNWLTTACMYICGFDSNSIQYSKVLPA